MIPYFCSRSLYMRLAKTSGKEVYLPVVRAVLPVT